MKLTKEGIAIVEGDMLLSRYVEEQGHLDVDHGTVDLMHQYIPEGGYVIDVGACIGDHTISYSEFVGPKGKVYAVEPNPIAYECLAYNMKNIANVEVFNYALGALSGHATVIVDSYNVGASRLTNNGYGPIEVKMLDDVFRADRLDFIKIDAEGYEPLIIAGAMETLERFRPVMLVEVSREQLGHLNFVPDDIYRPLENLGYRLHRTQPELHQFDLLCI